jgi:MscS family membrane protein
VTRVNTHDVVDAADRFHLDRSVTEYMPESLLKLGPWGLAYWQWLGIAIGIVLAFVAGRIASRVVLWLGHRIVARTESTLDDEALDRLNRPVRFLGKVLAALALLPLLELPAGVAGTTRSVLLALLGAGAIWCAVSLIDVVTSRLALAQWAKARPASRGLLSLAGRTLKVLLVIIATITFLGSLGLPVGSLIAGVGIGGIALAFGAQKTVENLFGAFALGIDQPLREGDFVKTDADTMGTVEAVGLRSTRIRTLDRTIVSMPNGKLADMKIETFGERDRVRLHTMLNLVYSTTAAQMREVVAGIEAVLRAHADTYKDEIVVRFRALGASSLDIEVMTWYAGTDFARFRDWRQEMLLAFMTVVETAGTRFAFPSQTLHIASVPKAS